MLYRRNAPRNQPFITVGNQSILTAERAIEGTTNRISVTDNGANSSIVISAPQDLDTAASPTFAGMTLSGLTASRLLSSDGSKALASVADLASWVAGTANRVTVTADGDGSITLSGPQDLHTSAAPSFQSMTFTTSGGQNHFNVRNGTNPVAQMIGSGDHTGLEFLNFGATFLPFFSAQKARGTQSSPLGVSTNDTLFRILAIGYYDNAGVGVKGNAAGAVQIAMRAGQAWSSTAQGTYVQFNTTPNGSTTVAERMRIHTNGFVGIAQAAPTAILHLGAGTATANTAPFKFTTGTNLTTAEVGAMEYNNTFHLTDSDATRRHVVVCASATKTVAGAPYANDGYVTMRIGGTDVKVMTTA